MGCHSAFVSVSSFPFIPPTFNSNPLSRDPSSRPLPTTRRHFHSSRPNMLVNSFLIRTSPRWVTVEPAKPAVPHQHVLFIDRNTLSATLRKRIECAALAEPDTETVGHGLVGLVDTLHDSHLIVVSERELIGDIMERPVFRVKKLEAIAIRGKKMLKKIAPTLGLSKSDLAEESTLRAMLTNAVATNGFHFSHAIDLTRCAQKRADVVDNSNVALPDFVKADMKFVWNRYAAQKLIDIGAVSWIVPLILGYVDVRKDMINGKCVQLALISRRCADRPGLRFTARGADIHGNCSNFVETEQIVSHGETYSSYVQLRGSIPLLWKQEAALIYKPKPQLKQTDSGGKNGLCQSAFEKHFDSLLERHGPVTAISLIDNKGSEGMMAEAYKNAFDMMSHPKLHFVPWEFHQQTKGMKYEKVENELLTFINSDIEAYSYFYSKDGTTNTITRRQRGIIRTNCIDSLDRTNVVQSVIAHRIMDASLKVMGVLDSNPDTNSVKCFETFEKHFKNTWADHADALSNFYAGSGALKTDFTRTGKRSKLGMVQDGIRALRRYIYQNFLDGKRQDGIDVLLGVVRMPENDIHNSNEGDDISQKSARKLAAIETKAEPLLVREKFCPHLAFLSLVGAVVGGMFIKGKIVKMIVILVCIGAFALFLKLTLKAGHKLIPRPKLDGTH